MKTETRANCVQQPRPTSSQASLCLPFCGLGAEQFVNGKAALCGALHPEQLQPRAADLAEAAAES